MGRLRHRTALLRSVCDRAGTGTPAALIAPLTLYNSLMKNETNFDRITFASLTGRAGQPMDWDGDFDDHFTAEDYDRRRAQRDGWGGRDSWNRYCR